MSPIRVLLADDHPPLRAGIRQRLEREADLVVVGEAGDGAETLRLAEETRPHVLVLDMQMPRLSGLEVMRKLQEADRAVRVLALTAHAEEHYVTALLDRGAAGYLLKHESLDTIVSAVRGVAAGEEGWLSRSAAAAIVKQRRGSQPLGDPASQLSPRERQVLVLLGRGLSNQQIAERLFVSESTVKKHVNNIYGKLEVGSRGAAVAWAWEHGVVVRRSGAKG